MPPKKVYKKLDPITHILERSDMYVGSKRLKKIEEYIATEDKDTYKIVKKYINSSPAILRIFVEVLSNAIDNVERSRITKTPCTTIKVNIDKETGETSVWNDGDIIPIEIHEEEKIYNHSLIFGNLMAGSNYDDTEERLVAGRNGLGSKCQKFGTLIPCFDGSIKKVEDIKIGDYLIGDDGKKREVLNTIHGFGEMYEVLQSRGDSYTVNSEHILSLRMPDHKVIFWSTEKQGWQMVYLDAKNQKIHSKSIRALKSPGTECPECNIILNSNLPRLKNIVHRNGHLYKYVNKAIDDKNFKLLEFLLKYGKFCQGTCQYCNFAEDVKALKLALKYKFINLKDTSEMTEALKMAAIRGNTNAIKMLLGYSFKHKIQFSFASVLNRAKRIRNENILKLLENFYSKNHDLDNTNVDYAQYH